VIESATTDSEMFLLIAGAKKTIPLTARELFDAYDSSGGGFDWGLLVVQAVRDGFAIARFVRDADGHEVQVFATRRWVASELKP
jgi:hypothetical protein